MSAGPVRSGRRADTPLEGRTKPGVVVVAGGVVVVEGEVGVVGVVEAGTGVGVVVEAGVVVETVDVELRGEVVD